MHNINYLLICIDEMSQPKKDSIRGIHPFALRMLEHLGKIYVTQSKSNLVGTVRSQIINIQRVNFRKMPTRFQYFRYIYSSPMHSGLFWENTPIGLALTYKDNLPTEEEYNALTSSPT